MRYNKLFKAIFNAILTSVISIILIVLITIAIYYVLPILGFKFTMIAVSLAGFAFLVYTIYKFEE